MSWLLPLEGQVRPAQREGSACCSAPQPGVTAGRGSWCLSPTGPQEKAGHPYAVPEATVSPRTFQPRSLDRAVLEELFPGHLMSPV